VPEQLRLLRHIGFLCAFARLKSPSGENITQRHWSYAKHKEENMLVLSRTSMEGILIGDCVVVTVLEIRGNKALIGIDAPKDIHVLRSELLDRVSKSAGNGSLAKAAPTPSYDPRGIEALEIDGPSG
jgi:carbon storage regulator